MQDLSYRQLTITDSIYFSEALGLLSRTQGEGIFKPGYLERFSEDSNAFVLGAFLKEALIGIAVARVLSHEDISRYILFGEEILSRLQLGQTGMLVTASVVEKYQGYGIGQDLMKQRITWLEQKVVRQKQVFPG